MAGKHLSLLVHFIWSTAGLVTIGVSRFMLVFVIRNTTIKS